MYCYVSESSRENNIKFNFLGIIWESKRSLRVIFRLSKNLNPKFWQPWCNLWDILGVLQTTRFELLGDWNVCITRAFLQVVSDCMASPRQTYICFSFWFSISTGTLTNQRNQMHAYHCIQIQMHSHAQIKNHNHWPWRLALFFKYFNKGN